MSRRFRAVSTRFVHLVIVLFGVSIAVFGMMYLLPGDPAETIVAGSSNPDAVEEVRKELGLDRPPVERYLTWIGGAVTGDLGQSYRTHQPVTEAIVNRLPVTFQLILMAEIISLAVAIPLAIAAARRRNTPFDRGVAFFTFALQCTPNFVVALVLILIFAVNLRLLPAVGYVPVTENPLENLQSLIIPSVALATALIPLYTRVLRSEMINTLQEDFILLARAVGLPSRKVLMAYALKPSMPTLVTVIGINIGTLIGGTLIVESISSLPGLGTLLFRAINDRDYIVVQGIVLFIAVVYVLMNFLVDLVYTFLDPRVKA